MPWRRKDGRWTAQVRRGQSRIQKIFPSKAEAIQWEADQKRKPAEEWQTPWRSRLEAMANEYLVFSKANHSKKSYEEKKYLFRRFFTYVDSSLSYEALKPEMLLDYLQEQARKRSGYSANKDRKHLLAWANWVNQDKGILNPSFALIKEFPEEKKTRNIPSEKDFWLTYENAEREDKNFLLAHLFLAARRDELLRLRWADIDFAGRRVRLIMRKSEDESCEEQWLAMTDGLRSALEAQRGIVNGDLVFPNHQNKKESQDNFMQRLCKKAGVKYFDNIAIRHLAAYILGNSGVPIRIIQAIMRHKNLPTNERFIYELRELRQALELLSREITPKS